MASIFFRTVILLALLSVSMKLMGKREIGELEVGELITTLLISEISTIPIQDPEIPLINAIIPVLFIVSAEVIISYFKNKSTKLKRIIDGDSVFLIYDGKFREDVLRKNRLSIEEFMTAMRQAGIASISDIQYCVLEANGKISLIKKEGQSQLSHVVISDGEIIKSNLTLLGLDEKWLTKALGGKRADEIFMMTAAKDGSLYIVPKEKEK